MLAKLCLQQQSGHREDPTSPLVPRRFHCFCFRWRSGAGKSTLAALIEDEIDAALIPLDDFFSADIPDSQWDQFTVEQKLRNVFDWKRLRAHAIEPLLKGSPGVVCV